MCVCVRVCFLESKGCEWTPKSHYWSALPPRHTLGSRAVKWPLWWFTLNPLTPLPHYPLLFFYSSTVSPCSPQPCLFIASSCYSHLNTAAYCFLDTVGLPYHTTIYGKPKSKWKCKDHQHKCKLLSWSLEHISPHRLLSDQKGNNVTLPLTNSLYFTGRLYLSSKLYILWCYL